MKNNIELLSPAGDFNCLKAAVQNGADCIYLGTELFNARASAQNFNLKGLEEAIHYCKIRGVKTNLALNILMKNNELNQAFEIAKKAYEFGIDAIIVQDLGLARILINTFPDLPIHASTQMTIHNLQGALELQNLGFKRVVLSRELSIEEIEYIAQNTQIEIECFIHGALCISYSGQCLFSSMIGGRSGNRGKCAQPCRLPYSLIENENTVIDTGYILSPRDLCSLDYIPRLINSNVTSLKIEGRMKSPEYVATVTKIYRKYIDLALSDENYIIDDQDKKELLQVFNRGNFSTGHLDPHPNTNFIFKEKPNNMGLFLGHIARYNPSKGLITLCTNEPLKIGDTISIENEPGTYTISELMKKNDNIKQALSNELITIGRMKGNIKVGKKLYKMSSKTLSQKTLSTFENNIQTKQIALNCEVKIQKNKPISMHVSSANNLDIYKKLDIYCQIDEVPQDAIKHPLEKEKIISQITKTSNTPYYFKNINIILDENLFLPNIKSLNELRRTALSLVEKFVTSRIKRTPSKTLPNYTTTQPNLPLTTSLLLNTLSQDTNYSKLENIDNIYIPLKYFIQKDFKEIIKMLNTKFNLYIYLPTIIKPNYQNFLSIHISEAIEKYKIKGFILSNISNFKLLENYKTYNFELIGNYTLNVFNNYTIQELSNLGITKFTLSPELDKKTIESLASSASQELIVYGKTPLMNMSYCPIGKSNHCYPNCKMQCQTPNKYYIKDRMNLKFPILPDNIQTISTLYNCKTISLSKENFPNTSVRIDILDETIDEIQNIINTVHSGKRFEGQEFTNGNINKSI